MRADQASHYRVDLTIVVKAADAESAKTLARGLAKHLKGKQSTSRQAEVEDADVIDVRAI